MNNAKQAAPTGSATDKRIEDLEGKIRELALTIDTVEDEKLEITNQLKKALADYQNLERAIDKRMELRLKQLKYSLAQELIPVMDDIKYGVDAAAQLSLDEKASAWLEGTKSTLQKLPGILQVLDVEQMSVAVGDLFNAELHEAVAVVPGENQGEILEVVQPGYLMDGQLLKPAKVVVVKNLN